MIEILIFTYNRPKYLKRSIEYWSSCNYKIIIADGSTNFYQDNLPKNFEYFHLPGTGLLERTIFLANKTNSEYAVFCADDDFHSIHGINESVNFLKKNSDYASVQGLFLRVGEKHDPQSILFGTGYTSNISINTKCLKVDSKILLKEFIKLEFPFCYSVMRKEAFKIYSKVLEGIDLDVPESKKGISVQLFEDIMPYVVYLAGHYKTLPIFYSMRQNQIRSYGTFYNKKLYLNDFYADWVNKNDKDWNKIKNNINKLIHKKYNFNFDFTEKDVLAKYLEGLNNKNLKKIRIIKQINQFRRLLNQIKIYLYILIKINFNLINYFSFYKFMKRIKKIVKHNNVE